MQLHHQAQPPALYFSQACCTSSPRLPCKLLCLTGEDGCLPCREAVRKKAVMALHRFHQLDPRHDGPLAGLDIDKHLRTSLCDKVAGWLEGQVAVWGGLSAHESACGGIQHTCQRVSQQYGGRKRLKSASSTRCAHTHVWAVRRSFRQSLQTGGITSLFCNASFWRTCYLVVFFLQDPGVMSASLCALYEVVKQDPRPYKNLIPSFTSILKQVGYPLGSTPCRQGTILVASATGPVHLSPQ
jgi:hypothetical protein